MPEHPSLEDIALFVHGQLPDPSVIEQHIDECADCAAEVVLGREMRYMDSLGLIPKPRAAQKPMPKQSPERTGKLATEPPSSGKGIVPGIAGGLGLAGILDWLLHPTPTPALGEQDPDTAHPDHPSNLAEQELRDSYDHHAQAEHPENSENSGHSPVTHEEESASHDKEAHSSSSRELEEFLDKARATLDAERAHADDSGPSGHAADHDSGNSSGEPDEEGFSQAGPKDHESEDEAGEESTDFKDHDQTDHDSDQHTHDHHDDLDHHTDDPHDNLDD